MQRYKFRTRFSLISSGKNSEEKQIHLVCTLDGNEVFYYSKFRVHPDNFIKETVKLQNSTVRVQQVKKNTFNKAGEPAGRINARLRELENAAQTVYEKHYSSQTGKLFDKDEFRQLLQIELNEDSISIPAGKELFDIYEEYIRLAKVTENRKRHYRSDLKRLREYAKRKNITLTEKNFDPVEYKSFLRDLVSENTAVCILKRIRAFFNFAKNEIRCFETTPFDNFKFSDKLGIELYAEPVCMTREELTLLYTTKYPNKDDELCRDMFCLQAAFGCRVSDFVRLTYNNIQSDQLIYYPSKTSEYANKVVVPLSNRAKEIMKKYKKTGPNNLIMPFLHSTDYNEQLKTVFRIAGLDRTVIQYSRDEKKEKFYKLYELASSHLARRTFVDILCQAGEPIHVVASMSGHSEHSKAFDRYRRRPEQLQKDAVSRSMD
ncbi:MAG: site-specific integrase [Tannerella sp.]|nr:site-specific integrase [Tannerella sp.]